MREQLPTTIQSAKNFVRATSLTVALVTVGAGSISLGEAVIEGIDAHRTGCNKAEIQLPAICKKFDREIDEELEAGLAAWTVAAISSGLAWKLRPEEALPQEEPA